MNKPAYMCHCCSCCCEVMVGINQYGKYATHASNFIPILEPEECTSCGFCTDRCPITAIFMQEDDEGTELPMVKEEMCLGCGVCASSCPTEAITMSRRAELHVPPQSIRERNSLMVNEKSKE